MKLLKPQTIQQIAAIINTQFKGNANHIISGINEIHMVEHGDLTFVDHPKYYDKALQSKASTILINKEVECPPEKALLFSTDPFKDYNILTTYFRPFQKTNQQIAENSTIGKNTIIRPGVFIGENVIIGDNCVIHANVAIYDYTVIGNNVEIHANSVIGADAFYFKKYLDKGYTKMHSCGRVIIEDNVTIGASCTIDKGVSGDTKIGKGSKLDNAIHIGHDTVIGKNCLFAAQVGVAGVVTIEDDVILWGQVGVQKDLTIGKGAVILGQSGIAKSVEGGKTYFGSPINDAREKMKEIAALKQLPEILRKLNK